MIDEKSEISTIIVIGVVVGLGFMSMFLSQILNNKDTKTSYKSKADTSVCTQNINSVHSSISNNIIQDSFDCIVDTNDSSKVTICAAFINDGWPIQCDLQSWEGTTGHFRCDISSWDIKSGDKVNLGAMRSDLIASTSCRQDQDKKCGNNWCDTRYYVKDNNDYFYQSRPEVPTPTATPVPAATVPPGATNTPVPTAIPTQTNLVSCQNNPPGTNPPPDVTWQAQCDVACSADNPTGNNECATRLDIPSDQAWCYRFRDGLRCLKYVYNGPSGSCPAGYGWNSCNWCVSSSECTASPLLNKVITPAPNNGCSPADYIRCCGCVPTPGAGGQPTATPTPPPGATSTPAAITCNPNNVSMAAQPNPVTINNDIKFTVGGSEGDMYIGDNWSGGVNCNGNFWGEKTCSANQAGTYRWIHSWKKCVGDAEHCSANTCSKYIDFTVNNISQPTNTPVPTAIPTPIPIPNCKNISGPTTVVVGNTYSYRANYENYNGTLTTAGMVAVSQGTCNPYILNGMQNGGPNTYTFNWTPTTAGNYTVFCRAWNDGIAECRGTCVGNAPLYSCPGPNATLNITAVDSTPTPTFTPIPTNTPIPTPTAAPRPTNTPVPGCGCGSDNNCTASCVFDKFSGVTYPSTISCNLSSSLFPSSPTADNKTSWCRANKRTKGDANEDGIINNLDYMYYVSAVNGGKIATTVNVDFNGDGEVGVADRIIIIKSLNP